MFAIKWTVIIVVVSVQCLSQMPIRWQITSILMTLPPKIYIRTRNTFIFIVFFLQINTCPMIYVVIEIDTDRKYYFWDFIWCQICDWIVICVEVLSENH